MRRSLGKVFVLVLLIFALVSCKPVSIQQEPTATTTTLPPEPEVNAITVISSEDSGSGTLRQALENVQDDDTILFAPTIFPPDSPITIFVSSGELPHIRASNITIDASNAGVILDGSQIAGDWIAGLQIVNSSDNKIMGLQITHFPGPGIAISGNSKNNIIGGDRSLGDGPFGQGNQISNNVIGIDISSSNSTDNTITGNMIGTDNEGADWLGNERYGVSISEGAHDNTVGPDNIIANNGGFGGVYFQRPDSESNTSYQNEVYANAVGKEKLTGPSIFEFDLSAGTVTGATCANCGVEIYSIGSDKEKIFEGEATADEFGVFTFNKDAAFTGTALTARSTDLHGRTSHFQWLTSGTSANIFFQENDLPRVQTERKASGELIDNRIGTQFDSFGLPEDFSDYTLIYNSGVTRVRVSISGMEPELVNWEMSEIPIAPSHDDMFTRMADHGITVTYVLMFWDMETYPNGEGAPCARFKTEEEIEHYLEYVRYTVDQLKDRVDYFEIWNEPDIRNFCPKWIESVDYINLVKRTVPVIREVYPEAKIVVGGVSKMYYPDAYNYLLDLLESDIMPLVDVISWHPMYGESPEEQAGYYNNYPAMVENIKTTAAANGFVGEYSADELSWSTSVVGGSYRAYSALVANKYFSQSALMHLGSGINVGATGSYFILTNLSNAVAGAEPMNLPLELQSTLDNLVSYSFTMQDGDYLVALWTAGKAIDDENYPGVETDITIPGITASEVMGTDIFFGMEQELETGTENGNLVINNLIVKDYPILLRITP
jgi:hypothetical protein